MTSGFTRDGSCRGPLGILGLLALVGGLALVKFSQIRLLIQSGENAKAAGPPAESVSTGKVEVQSWDSSITAVGSVEANRGVTIANDAPGVVKRVHFQSGDEVEQGQVLVELDASVERAQLASAVARRDLAQTTLDRAQSLARRGAMTQQELEQAESTFRTASADVNALRAQVERKWVRAPFNGRLGIRQVNLGQYLAPGTPLTTLQSSVDDYVDFSVPQQRLSEVKVGLPVVLSIRGGQGPDIKGSVVALNPQVDEETRTFTVRAQTEDAGELLVPGMFVSARILLPTSRKAVLVPTPAVVYASFGNSVFVVEEQDVDGEQQLSARQQFVRTGETRGDFVEVEDGLNGDETVVTAGAFKLRNGARISVNNDIKVDAKLSPHPQNR